MLTKKRFNWIQASLFICALFFLLLTLFCQPEAKGPRNLTILHTNDMHVQFIPSTATWIQSDPKPQIGGIAVLKTAVDMEKNEATLVLDAGDTQTGTLLSSIEVDGVLGGAFVHMMNRIGYDASVIGNHELDNGWENVQGYVDLANFDWLSANLFFENALWMEHGYRIYKKNELDVGVIGLTIAPLAGLVPASRLGRLEVFPVAETAQTLIDQIDSKTDCIILLTHHGFYADSVLAESIQGADVIVGGHSHTLLREPRVVNDVIIVQAGSRCRDLGRLELTVEGDTISQFFGKLIPLWVDSIKADPELAQMAEQYKNQIENEYGKQIGKLKNDWIRNDSESNIGNFLTDVLRHATETDFAVMNSGGIRRNLEAGAITVRDIHEIIPFQNHVVTFSCTGQDLLDLLKRNAEQAAKGRGILQMSGLACQYDILSGQLVEIKNATISGKPIQAEKSYNGASVDYVAADNAGRFLGFTPSNLKDTYSLLSDVVIGYIRENPDVDSSVEGRLTSR